MLAVSAVYPSAAKIMTAISEPESLWESKLDRSFLRQIAQVSLAPQTVAANLDTPPDVYALTAFSAIPIADAVRGFYARIGMPCPAFVPVAAHNRSSRDYFATASDGPYRKARHTENASFLRPYVEGAKHVAVIDQYVGTGNTITYAAHLLLAAGAESVTAIRGNWYEQITETLDSGIDVRRMTSRHAGFMLSIGHVAADIASTLHK
jgi:hypothetical protein